MNSNFLLIAKALDMGIPIEYDGQLYKLFKYDNKLPELKYAVINSLNGDNSYLYIDDVPMKFMYMFARDLTEAESIKLLHLVTQVKYKLENGVIRENLTFDYEDAFFEKLEKYI